METNEKWYIRGKKGCTEQIRKEFIKRGADDLTIDKDFFDEEGFIYYLLCGLVRIVECGSILGERIVANWEEVKVEEAKPKPQFKPFDMVLACDGEDCHWVIGLYERYDDTVKNYPHVCLALSYRHCIPYEGNEHLVGVKFDPKHIEGYEWGE